LLQRNPLISKINAELSTGFTPGGVILQVTVEEANTFNVQVAIDNNRSPSVGTFRREVTVSEANLLGLGDSASIGYKNTDASNELELNYTVPFNSTDGTVSFKYRLASSEVIESPFDQLNISSDYRNYEFNLHQPIIRKVNEKSSQEFALGLNFSRQESDNYLSGKKFQFSTGADENGHTNISALRLSQEYTNKGFKDVFLARSEFSFGLNWFDATINNSVDPLSKTELPDSNFFIWRGQLQWLHLLNTDTTLLLRSGLQFADRPLVSLEQFGYGGFNTVRGYRQDAQLTDNGIFAGAELQYPLYHNLSGSNLLSIHPFIDVGTGWNTGRVDPKNNTLLGAGFGLQWRSGDRFKARLDYGIPLIDINSGDKKTWQENGIYFTLEYNFF
jgi:hemolysin activation/secretion protein